MRTYKVGDRFQITTRSVLRGEYILAQIAYKTFSLISLSNGNRWTKAVHLNIPYSKIQTKHIRLLLKTLGTCTVKFRRIK